MTGYRKWFAAMAFLALASGLANAQVGVATGGSGQAFACSANVAGVPQLRQEGYTELLGDIVISCTGGATLPAAAAIPTTNITVYVPNAQSITSREFGSPSGASEALLLIDEPGSGIATGAAGNYGPKAPQTLCSTAQQQQAGGSACGAFVGSDPGRSGGPYQVAVSTSGGATAAANVYQGKIGAFGANSVTFYNVPVLPPALAGVSRTYRITNLRAPMAWVASGSLIYAAISTSGGTSLPGAGYALEVGVLGNAMIATVDPAPSGGGSPFSQCAAPQGAALTARVHFTEGFATMFKTRVAPLTNTTWASTVPNIWTPGQNMPGGLYGGFAQNNESGFIFPAATATVGAVTYTAGLADFGTRLKAVFTNIPSGVQLYVSTTNAGSYAVPGGTGTAPYAVLVGGYDATNDSAVIAPLTAGTVAGSDGLTAYPLTPDATGTAAAVWEVVNANPGAIDTLTFSVYISYNGTPAATTQPGIPANNVALSLAPEPGGGSFTAGNALEGLTTPVPRDTIPTPQQGSWVAINACSINVAGASQFGFFTTLGSGTAPPSQTVTVSTTPAGLTVAATPAVTTPAHGTWLSASLSGGTLTISANPAGLAASATAYTGSVTLSATGVTSVVIPVTLTVYPAPVLSIGMGHSMSFEQGQQGASYAITVSNAAGAGSTGGTVTVTEQPPGGLTLATMSGSGWNCATLPICTRSDSLPAGLSYAAITATVNVSSSAPSPLVNIASLSYGGSVVANATDSTTILPPPVLGVTLRHSGNFTQGQTNAVYTVTVNNTAAASPTNAPVLVTETVPTGLTLVSMAGTGWTCSGNTCSSQNALPGLSSYYPIAVTVNAAANAPLYVTNQVTVSGGGALSAASASDVTLVDTPAVQYLISTYAGGFATTTAAVATSYPLMSVSGVAVDRSGNTYLSSSLNCVFKVDPAGNLMRVAGTCRTGYSGDGGPAVQAQLNAPRALAVDSAGNLYIADSNNNRIRRVDASGIITTVVGTGTGAYSGDNGPATSATINYALGVCVDSSGNLYIGDTFNQRVRKVTGGVITTVAGGGAFSGDAVAATSAALTDPEGVAVDSAGNLYIAETGSHRVRMVALNGIITTIAGTAVDGYSGDGGPATAAQLNAPTAMAPTSGGSLLITDTNNNRVRSVSPGGIISTVAGNGGGAYSGDGGPATSASVSIPLGVAVDASGSLYIADAGDGRARKVTPGGIISTLAGNGVLPYFFGDGGPAALAGLSGNWGVAVDTANNLYIADSTSYRVRKVTSSGAIATIAGTGIFADTGDGGQATNAAVNPSAVAVDSAGNVYLGGFSRVRKIAANGTITTVAGTGAPGYSGDNGPATGAQLSTPIFGLAVDSAGNLYISDSNNYRVRRVTPGGTITTVAGTGIAGYSGDGGSATSARLGGPEGLSTDAAGNLYIADIGNSVVRKLAPNGTISTVAGNGLAGDTGDGGAATSAQIFGPRAVAVDSAGALYIGLGNGAVRKVSRGGFISTIAGNGSGVQVYGGDGGPALPAQFAVSYGVAVDGSGRVYVSDFVNNAVRILQPEGAQPLLAISQTHSGNFAWGQTGAAYAITVTNAALAGPTAGTVTLTEAIPAGLTLLSMAGAGWGCAGNICSRGDPLGAGASYPPVTVTVNVAAEAPPQVIAAATVSGGGSPGASAEDPTFVGATGAALGIVSTHTGNFTQGQTNATYTLTVSNLAGAPTSGTVTVTENLPTGLTLVSMAGTAWTCGAGSCTRSDGLVPGAQYPTITVTVSVASNAPLLVTNRVSVSGGNSAGDSATDPTSIYSTTPVLNIASTHSGSPTPSQNATYTLTVSNSTFAVATTGTVAVTENLPSGLTLVSMTGKNWSCFGNGCSRGDSLPPGASYDAITVTVGVAPTAASQVTNQVSAYGGGALSPASASDVTNIGGLEFYPLTPCRVADTRAGAGFSGTQGPPYLSGGTSRSFPVAGLCGVPASASAYSLNVTVVPLAAALGYLTTWPTGQAQPLASTLNSWEGQVVANAALVPAGTSGNISIYASDDTEVLFDINGYFAPPSVSGLQFYPLTPCRVADTRGFAGFSGTQGPPSLSAGTSRNFHVSGLCGVPSTAAAYSLNVTVVPQTDTLGYLTAWPAGLAKPWASTLNSPTGTVVANASLVPAGTNGDISIYASDATDVLFDVNGYFAAPGASGSDYYALTPCRVADTRGFAGFTEQFGPPSMGTAGSRSFAVQSSVCNVPSVATAYSLNVTAVPLAGPLGFLTTWPTGVTQPLASTLNSWDGEVRANAALVPAGTGTGGPIDIYVSDPADVLFDINGYFGPGQ